MHLARTCPHCQAEHDLTTTTCPETGRVWKCPACGTVVMDPAEPTCAECGFFFPLPAQDSAAQSAAAPMGVTCPTCHAPVGADDEVCSNCGQYLKGILEVAERPASTVEEKKPRVVRKKAEAEDRPASAEKIRPKRAADSSSRSPSPKTSSVKPSAAVTAWISLMLICLCAAGLLGAGVWAWRQVFPAEAVATFTPLASATPFYTSTATLTPTDTFTPTVTPTPTITPTFTPVPPSATPTLPYYEQITSSNASRLAPAWSIPASTDGLQVAFSPDGQTLAAAWEDGQVRLWDVYYGTLKKTLNSAMQRGLAVTFSPNGDLVYASGNDFIIYAFDARTGEIARKFFGHSGWVDKILFHPNEQWMASTNGSVILWNLETGKALSSFSSNATDFAFTPDGGSVVVPDMITVQTGIAPYALIIHHPILRVKNIQTGKSDSFYSFGLQLAEPGIVTTLDFTPDGRYLAAGGPENSVWIGDSYGSFMSRLYDLGVSAQITDVEFSPDGSLLAIASTDSVIRIFDMNSRVLVAMLESHRDAVRYVAFSADGRALASSSDDSSIILWRIR